jgi:uncharacterized protein (TIGR03000 family)
MFRSNVYVLAVAALLLSAGSSQAQRFFTYSIPGDPLLNNYRYGGYPSYGGNYPAYSTYYPSGGYSPGASYYPAGSWYSSQTNYYILPVASSATPSATRSTNEKAAIEVKVPASAQVWFDGIQTTQKGSDRYFATPALAYGKTYTYEVRATWKDADGNAITQAREVTVEPGKWSIVNFMDNRTP